MGESPSRKKYPHSHVCSSLEPTLCKSYMSLQDETKVENPSLSSLQNRLIEIKIEILEEAKPSIYNEFHLVRSHICEAKLTKTNQLCSLARVSGRVE